MIKVLHIIDKLSMDGENPGKKQPAYFSDKTKIINNNQPVSVVWLIAAFLVLGGLFVALDGYHYWHDIRFAFAAAEFSLAEVFTGVFNPHQAWTVSNEVSASGFYVSKMLHIALLSALFAAVDPAVGGFNLAVALSVLTMVCTVILAYALYVQLLRSRKIALFAIVCVLLAPIVPYLTGKLLAENSSLLFVTASLVLMMSANKAVAGKSVLLAISSGLLLAMAGLARLDSLFGPIGFFAALVIIPLDSCIRSATYRNILIALATFTVAYLSILKAAGFGIDILYDYLLAFVNAGQKSVLMSLIGIATFAGTVYILAFAGLFSKQTQNVRFFLIWLTITIVPALFITWNYMVEPRYLIQGLLPLCALGALGIDSIKNKLSAKGKDMIVLSFTFVMISTGLNYLFVRLMPYELDRPAMLAAITAIKEVDRNASILVPWSYTDYNFLRLVEPDTMIFNVNSSVNSSLDKNVEADWKGRFHGWYGEQYIAEQAKVNELLKDAPVFYLGWRLYPPVQNVHDFATAIGWDGLVALLNGLQMKDHRKESWLWDSTGFNMQYSGRSGQYEYYRVHSAKN